MQSGLLRQGGICKRFSHFFKKRAKSSKKRNEFNSTFRELKGTHFSVDEPFSTYIIHPKYIFMCIIYKKEVGDIHIITIVHIS